MASEWKTMPFTEAVTVNPAIRLQKGVEYSFVEMAAVEPDTRSVSESEYRQFKSGGSRFIPGDTLMARITPCLENGKIARFYPTDDANEIGFGSTEFIVIRGQEGTTTDDFAYYLTKSSDFRQFAIGQMTGSSGRQRVPANSLVGFEAMIPPLDVQERIAHILGSLDDKIELNRRMNETLEAMASALFKSWFVDFDPVIDKALAAGNPIPEELKEKATRRTALGNACKSLPPEIVAHFPDSFQNSELGVIPMGWEVGNLGHIADNPRRTVKPTDVPEKTPYIGLQHMPRHNIALNLWGRANEVDSGKYQFSENDILFGKLRPYFHKVGIAPLRGVCSTDILVVVPKSKEWYGYILALVSSVTFVDYTSAGSSGTKMPRTNWKDMSKYSLALPSTSLAEAFQSHSHAIHQRIVSAVLQSHRLAQLRDTLLPKLLSGELELSAAGAIAEEVL